MPTRKQARAAAANGSSTSTGVSATTVGSKSSGGSNVNGNSVATNGSAVSHAQAQAPAKQENIFLFIPNVVGYTRIVLAVASLYYMPLHPRTCSLLYSISCLLDAVDGVAARYFNQSTKFGAVLDMVTDRCTTSCLLVFLASAFPRWSIVFQVLISLDLASHYMHMYATLSMGGSGQSHKKIAADKNWLLRKYYGDNRVLFALCALNELFFIALYMLSFSSPKLTPTLLKEDGMASMNTDTAAAAFSILTMPNSAGAMEMARANKLDSTGPWALLIISALPMAIKQFINVVQLRDASRWLAEGDREQRAIAAATAASLRQ